MTEDSNLPPELETPTLDLEDVGRVDVNSILSASNNVDCHSLQQKLIEASKLADLADDRTGHRLFQILASLCTFNFKPEDKAEPFGPMMVMGDKRTPIPSDFRGTESGALAVIMGQLAHPGLRARVADTVWLNDRSNKTAAETACSAYRTCVVNLLEDSSAARFDAEGKVPREVIDLLNRMLRIEQISLKGNSHPDATREVCERLVQDAIDRDDPSVWLEATKMCLRYGLLDIDIAAQQSEVFAASNGGSPPLIQALWEFAAACHRRQKRSEDARRCAIEAAEQMVRTGKSMGGIAEAAWLMDAISALRKVPNTKDRRQELESDLRIAQREAMTQMGHFSHEMDLTDLAEATLEQIDGQSLAVVLSILADSARSRPIEAWRAEALDGLAKSPLSSLFSSSQVDDEGKIVSKSSGASGGEPDEDWFNQAIARNQGIHRQLFINGQFEPIRRHLASMYSLSERHFNGIVALSPFVPPGFEPIFSLGFARLIQGDYLSAAHLLIPQLENSLRYVLRSSGSDPAIIRSDLLQEDRSLCSLLTELSGDLKDIFGGPIIDEADLLFSNRAGPALRHEMAHGKLSAGHCAGPDVIYGCWFIYRLTCLPLLPHWDELIVPEIKDAV